MEVATLARLPLFPKDDTGALSELLARLICDRVWVREIATQGQRLALQEFTSDRMVDRIEAMLLRILGEPEPMPAAARAKSLALQVSA